MKEYKLILIAMICMFILGITITQLFNSFPLTNIQKEYSSNNVYDSSKCANLSLINTAYCLNIELSSFYVYNISNIGKKLNESEFRKFGGVCKNAVDYYIGNLKSLGYEQREPNKIYINDTNNTKFVTEVDFRTSNNSSHAVAIISGKEGNESRYCILDQELVNCWGLI